MMLIKPEVKNCLMSCFKSPSLIGEQDKLSLPKPAELVTLPSHMDCHDHSYTQIVIGLQGKAEFEVSGFGIESP